MEAGSAWGMVSPWHQSVLPPRSPIRPSPKSRTKRCPSTCLVTSRRSFGSQRWCSGERSAQWPSSASGTGCPRPRSEHDEPCSRGTGGTRDPGSARAQGHPRLGPGRPVRCARQVPERAGEAERRPISARLRLRPDQGGGRAAGDRKDKAKQPFGIAASINWPAPPATTIRRSSTCGAHALVLPVPPGAWDSPEDTGRRQIGDRRRDLIRVAIYVFTALSRISSPSARNRLRFVARRCSCGSQRSSYWVRVEHVVSRPTPT